MAIDLEYFREQCKKHKLKITPQRIVIYEVVLRSREHPTTARVYKTVKKKFPHISFDTVHRTLLTLSRINLVDIVEGFGSAQRFDSNLKIHHHLYCEKCSKIIDFTHKAYDNFHVPKKLTSNFKVKKTRVIISGLCKECQESGKIIKKKIGRKSGL